MLINLYFISLFFFNFFLLMLFFIMSYILYILWFNKLIINLFLSNFFNKKSNNAKDLPNYENFFFFSQKSVNNLNIFGMIRFYIISFFSGAWYLDIAITKLAYYASFGSIYVFYYVIDKGVIYLFGPEGLVSFFLFLSKKLALIQSGITSLYLNITILSIFIVILVVSLI